MKSVGDLKKLRGFGNGFNHQSASGHPNSTAKPTASVNPFNANEGGAQVGKISDVRASGSLLFDFKPPALNDDCDPIVNSDCMRQFIAGFIFKYYDESSRIAIRGEDAEKWESLAKDYSGENGHCADFGKEVALFALASQRDSEYSAGDIMTPDRARLLIGRFKATKGGMSNYE